MKKVVMIITTIILSLCIGYLGFSYEGNRVPHIYYQVYLNDQKIGIVESKEELEKYIDKQSSEYKKKYNVDTVYAPNGLEITKINTYSNDVDSIEHIYNELAKKGVFTILGYEFKVKTDDSTKKVYVLDKKIFEGAVEQTIETFVGQTNYQLYKNDNQKEITTTGSNIENVYVDNNITVKDAYIPVTEPIYTDVSTLAKYMLFGTTEVQDTYTVQSGDTIDNVAFKNKISVEEFLISNPKFTSANNLLFPGQEVVIGYTDPQIQVVVEKYTVEDEVSLFKTDEKYDPERLVGDNEVIQEGENGLQRVTRRTKIVNGTISYVEPINNEELKPTINKIIVRGEKKIPNVGSLTIWGWPTDSGWVITSGYGYRINPISGKRELHDALDIAGPGYGSNIYSTNNGTVVEAAYHYINGYYVIVNHNNGYYTYYGHMSKIIAKEGDTVARGQVIGLMGSTGWATGPHVHYAIYRGYPVFIGGYAINPWKFY